MTTRKLFLATCEQRLHKRLQNPFLANSSCCVWCGKVLRTFLLTSCWGRMNIARPWIEEAGQIWKTSWSLLLRGLSSLYLLVCHLSFATATVNSHETWWNVTRKTWSWWNSHDETWFHVFFYRMNYDVLASVSFRYSISTVLRSVESFLIDAEWIHPIRRLEYAVCYK